jgi:uncharacterized SAM-binding protein YcdF (DUF218 family)
MFLFKKIVALFSFPLLRCLVLLWCTRRQKAGKILVSIGTSLLLIFSYPFVPNLVLRPLEQRYPPAPDLATGPTTAPGPVGGQADKRIVVLSGGHTSDPELPAPTRSAANPCTGVWKGSDFIRPAQGASSFCPARGLTRAQRLRSWPGWP